MAAEGQKQVAVGDDHTTVKRVREDDVKEIKDTKEFKKARTETEDDANKSVQSEDERRESNEETKEDTKDETVERDETKEGEIKKETAARDGNKEEEVKEEIVGGDENKKKESAGNAKLTFGASCAFGSGFKMAQKDPNDDSKKEHPKPFAFGSGLSFGSGFGVLKKADKELPEKTPEEAPENTPENTPELSDSQEKSTEYSSSAPQVTVKLQKQEVKSGEEAEETLYQANAKLYQYTDIKTGWKERGIGVIKVNKNVHSGKARIVMRSRGMLKVILNLSLVKGFTVQKGFLGSMQSEKFIRMVTQDDNKAPIQTAVKTSKKEIAEGLYDSIVKLIPK